LFFFEFLCSSFFLFYNNWFSYSRFENGKVITGKTSEFYLDIYGYYTGPFSANSKLLKIYVEYELSEDEIYTASTTYSVTKSRITEPVIVEQEKRAAQELKKEQVLDYWKDKQADEEPVKQSQKTIRELKEEIRDIKKSFKTVDSRDELEQAKQKWDELRQELKELKLEFKNFKKGLK